MTTFIVIVIIVSLIALIVFKRGETMRFETTARTPQILMQANSEVGTKKRWTVVGQTQNNVVFAYQKGPNKLIALILIICFIIPGIVYLVLAGKRESLNVMFDERPDGLILVQATSNGYRGKLAGRSLRSALAAGTPAVQGGPQHHQVSAHVAQHPVIPAATWTQPALTQAALTQPAYIQQPATLEEFQRADAAPASQYPAAWYPDPHSPGNQRYFDGQQWTEHRTPNA